MNDSSSALLQVRELGVRFRVRRGLFGRHSYDLAAVDDVSFDLEGGQTLGLVGESGAGKSTVGRALLKLVDPSEGRILLDDRDVAGLKGQVLDFRRDLQAIFQDPYASLNPAMVVGDIISEPLKIHFRMSETERVKRVSELMRQVGLPPQQMHRYPSEFSGGQRQRIAIATALTLEPRLIVCDEAVSALDVSTQSQVINLLQDLQQRLGIALLFIAHDLAVVRHISHRIGVLYLGQLVELGDADTVCESPAHPYTRSLLEAVPLTDPIEQKRRKEQRSGGKVVEPPSPMDRQAGCPFSARCPKALPECTEVRPSAVTLDNGTRVACHLYSS